MQEYGPSGPDVVYRQCYRVINKDGQGSGVNAVFRPERAGRLAGKRTGEEAERQAGKQDA